MAIPPFRELAKDDAHQNIPFPGDTARQTGSQIPPFSGTMAEKGMPYISLAQWDRMPYISYVRNYGIKRKKNIFSCSVTTIREQEVKYPLCPELATEKEGEMSFLSFTMPSKQGKYPHLAGFPKLIEISRFSRVASV